MKKASYKDSGVDINKKANLVKDIYKQTKKTFNSRVIENPNGFAGLFSLNGKAPSCKRDYKDPVLVASTDGVGTKLKIAFMMNKHDTVGIDLVAMCVNDTLVYGAEILFFLDYMASSNILPEVVNEIIKGITEGCRQAECSLLGGETPELPGFYNHDEYDLAGFSVGAVERDRIIKGTHIESGDIVIGLKSSGLHSNGYSLVRNVLLETAKLSLDQHIEELKTTLGEELIRPTKIYVRPVLNVLKQFSDNNSIKGIAHITGGGLIENIPRILPEGTAVNLIKENWLIPEIFNLVKKHGNIDTEEMFRVFNMGIGMVLFVNEQKANAIIKAFKTEGEEALVIGSVLPGDRIVEINY